MEPLKMPTRSISLALDAKETALNQNWVPSSPLQTMTPTHFRPANHFFNQRNRHQEPAMPTRNLEQELEKAAITVQTDAVRTQSQSHKKRRIAIKNIDKIYTKLKQQ